MEEGLDAAIADFDKALALDPRLDVAYYNRGNAHQDKGELAAAMADYDKALALNPALSRTYAEQGFTYLLEGRSQEAEKDFAQALKLGGNLRAPIDERAAQIKRQLATKKKSKEIEILKSLFSSGKSFFCKICIFLLTACIFVFILQIENHFQFDLSHYC